MDENRSETEDDQFFSLVPSTGLETEDKKDVPEDVPSFDSSKHETGLDPDHIDISALSSSHNISINQEAGPMQSIDLDSQRKDDTIGHIGNTATSDLSLNSSIENLSDVVEMPPIDPKVSTSTSYFACPTNQPSFIHQITPDTLDIHDIAELDANTDSELWLPSPATFELISQSNSCSLDPQYLTKVRPNSTVALVSPAIELVTKYHGESIAQGLQSMPPPASEENLKILIKEGRFLTAINMLTELLNCCDVNVHSIKLWTLRFALLLNLKLYSTAEVEMAMFGNLDNCDLYFSFYSKEFPEKKGSIVPWSFRLIWSILPLHCPAVGGLYGALDRMYGLVHHLDQALLAGLPYSQEQRVIKYKINLLVQVAGALAGSGSVQPAIKILRTIKASQPDMLVTVSNAIIRLYYQVGNVHKGEQVLAEVQHLLTEEQREMNNGFKCIAHGEYNEAYKHFARAVNLNPSNTVASINGAVCLLYLGRLGDSIVQFEGAAKMSLHPMLLFNLVSLYELKTIASTNKKYHLLDNITSKSDWEAFPFDCLRL